MSKVGIGIFSIPRPSGKAYPYSSVENAVLVLVLADPEADLEKRVTNLSMVGLFGVVVGGEGMLLLTTLGGESGKNLGFWIGGSEGRRLCGKKYYEIDCFDRLKYRPAKDSHQPHAN